MAGQDPRSRTNGKGGSAPRGRGFAPAAGYLRGSIDAATRKRGFAEGRILTDWAGIAGGEVAAICTPLRMGHGPGGLGATLTLSIRPGHGPEIDMMAPALLDRINAACGYRAVARLRLAPAAGGGGFAEAASPFAPAPSPEPGPGPTPAVSAALADVGDDALRAALTKLATRIAARAPNPETSPRKGPRR